MWVFGKYAILKGKKRENRMNGDVMMKQLENEALSITGETMQA